MLSTMRAPLGPLHGWDFWRSQLKSPTSVCAPMVDQSERAFRLLCRELGVGLCYTPMLHARLFKEFPAYRELHFDAHEERGAAVHLRSESWPPAEGTEYTKGVAVMRGRGRLPPPFTRPLGWKEILMHTKCQLRRTSL